MLAEEIELLVAIENLENNENAVAHERQVHKNMNAFSMPEKKFRKTFRLSKDVARDLINIVRPYIVESTHASALTVDEKVLVALNFYGTGSYQMSVGENKNLAVSQASASRCISEVSAALNHPDVMNRFIKFPQTINELNILRRQFYERYGMPGIVGILDCTHVAIVPPKVNDAHAPEHIFVNRKNYHSVNVQLICDHNLKILHVNARFPGSTHDSHIWNNSNVKEHMQQLYQAGYDSYFLLGDSGYGLRPWLITPLAQPETEAEERFNEVQKSARSSIERCNGLLKMRFRCLLKHRTLHYLPNKASQIINACVVLHNICVENNIDLIDDHNADEEVDLGMFENNVQNDNLQNENVHRDPMLVAGIRQQRRLINYFR